MYCIPVHMYMVERSVWSVECRGIESHLRQLIFLRKSDCLGCAMLLCLVVCLTLLASFFLPSLISHLNMYKLQLGVIIPNCTCFNLR